MADNDYLLAAIRSLSVKDHQAHAMQQTQKTCRMYQTANTITAT